MNMYIYIPLFTPTDRVLTKLEIAAKIYAASVASNATFRKADAEEAWKEAEDLIRLAEKEVGPKTSNPPGETI
jgi:hypothetical protein